ncbi:hypothetical protein [Chryseobacterium cheonjiense]|uniref:Uncharacterized protein n=1 Tax=Chryseobacterium cheonjiense TaxID=2728845 RepID=A0A7Y0A8Z9_9FLAO|nr:hypothetical protein [Chryseobacterium cheonjiense]NML58651.1 hypothetical protein [Chryseobacterium cheonjiense]
MRNYFVNIAFRLGKDPTRKAALRRNAGMLGAVIYSSSVLSLWILKSSPHQTTFQD